MVLGEYVKVPNQVLAVSLSPAEGLMAFRVRGDGFASHGSDLVLPGIPGPVRVDESLFFADLPSVPESVFRIVFCGFSPRSAKLLSGRTILAEGKIPRPERTGAMGACELFRWRGGWKFRLARIAKESPEALAALFGRELPPPPMVATLSRKTPVADLPEPPSIFCLSWTSCAQTLLSVVHQRFLPGACILAAGDWRVFGGEGGRVAFHPDFMKRAVRLILFAAGADSAPRWDLARPEFSLSCGHLTVEGRLEKNEAPKTSSRVCALAEASFGKSPRIRRLFRFFRDLREMGDAFNCNVTQEKES